MINLEPRYGRYPRVRSFFFHAMRISAPIVLCVLASLLFASASSGWDCAPSLGIARPKLTFEDVRSERVQEGPGKQWRLYRTFVNIDNDDVAGEHPLSRLRRDGDAQLTAQHTLRGSTATSAACRQPRAVSRAPSVALSCA